MNRWRRGWTIILRLTPFVLAFLRDRRRFVLFGRPARRTAQHHERRAQRLTRTIARLGPTFIKLAQVFAARADILPEPYLSAIGTLQDRVPPDPFERIEAVLRDELGQDIEQVFDAFEREPVAAASLGQVHQATLKGERVAVKVLRPDVERLVAVDLDISFRVLYLVNVVFPNHHVRALTNVFREFSVRVREEMDFREESAHIALFHRHFADDARVRAPHTHDELTRRRVLVMEWIEGDKVDRLGERFASGDLDFHRMMETLTEIYFRMMLIDGFLHADPHAGNILVQRDGTLVFLDWGMVVQLNRGHRETLLRLAIAAARGNLDVMINGMYELGMIDPGISRGEIREAAAEIMATVERVKELGIKRVQEMLREIMDTFYTWPLMLPRELVYFFRATALLEGIGFRYDPDFNGLEVVRPVVKRMKTELTAAVMREPGDVARSALDELRGSVVALREVVGRAEREEFRVRMHPRDLMQAERFVALQVRRVLLSVFAFTVAMITAILFIAERNVWVLVGGLAVSFLMFLIVLFLPTHL
ncbi:MAG: ABC1 kinase family protein, partial [Longimicrobiales bacterium]